MITTSESIDQLIMALVRCQGALCNPQYNAVAKIKSERAQFEVQYTSLDYITEHVRDAMVSNGLCIVHSAWAEDKVMTVSSRICHESGQWMQNTIQFGVGKFNPQAAGAALTYGRRYTLPALLNIAASEDDEEEIHHYEAPSPAEKAGDKTRKQLSETREARHGKA